MTDGQRPGNPMVDGPAAGEPDVEGPVSDPVFAGRMAAVGPFEAVPRLAVAVSGGGDSMALCRLAEGWCRRQGGRLTALTVDHGLRPEAAAEARQVGQWLAALGVEHQVLAWRQQKPATGLQAAAREARYRLMTSWCREAGVLHLLLGHTIEDQAETFLMRLSHGSGPDGLAAMAAVIETPAVRLVRPLLGLSHRRLLATLEARGQPWIEDPSNRDPGFTRTRVRAALPALARVGIPPSRLAAAARHWGELRAAAEELTAALLARCVALYPAGYARIDAAALAAAPAALSLRALARILMCVGGRAYPPRRERLRRLHALVAGGKLTSARTLGGCRIVPVRDEVVVCREIRKIQATRAEGEPHARDDRFAADGVAGTSPGGGVAIACLGRDGWAEVVAERPECRRSPIPAAARPTLPALRDDRGVAIVPHLNYRRAGHGASRIAVAEVAFQPSNSLSGMGFFLA